MSVERQTRTISIPSDSEGYVLLKCSQCGELFKLKVADLEDDGVLNIHCPLCGYASYSVSDFLSDDVQKYMETLASNYAGKEINEFMHEFEKSLESNPFFNILNRDRYQEERPTPIKSVIDTLRPARCTFCGGYCKVPSVLRDSAYICPICGVKNFGT